MEKVTRLTEGSNQDTLIFETIHNSNYTQNQTGERLRNEKMCRRFAASASRIESLPAEIRENILFSLTDCQSLRNLTKASLLFHTQFKLAEEKLLTATLERELDGYTADAIATVESRPVCLEDPRTNTVVEKFMDEYHEWLHGPNPVKGLESLGRRGLKWLFQFHLDIITPLSKELAKCAMKNMANEKDIESSKIDDAVENGFELSPGEQKRLAQAMYRHQTYQHLFGNQGDRQGHLGKAALVEILKVMFSSWEIEAIACVDRLAEDYYDGLFGSVREGIPQLQSTVSVSGVSKPLRPVWASFNGYFRAASKGTVSEGFVRMWEFCRVATHHELLLSTTLERAEELKSYAELFDGVMNHAEVFDGGILLAEDAAEADDCPSGIDLAIGSMPCTYGTDCVPSSFRHWGYAIWDRDWWESFDAEDAMHRQWKDYEYTMEQYVRDCRNDLWT